MSCTENADKAASQNHSEGLSRHRSDIRFDLEASRRDVHWIQLTRNNRAKSKYA